MSSTSTHAGSPAKNGWATGGVIFAGIVMVMIGAFQILMGIAAIAKDSFLLLQGGYVYNVNLTGWGWIHLILGALVVITGLGLFTGATWAKVAGLVLVVLSAVSNFLFLPYYPIWSLVLIALDIFVVWALANSLRTSSAEQEAMMTRGPPTVAERGYGGDRWATNNPSSGYRADDPEAARRASDLANPAGARHAQSDTEAASEHAMSASGSVGRPPAGAPGGGSQPGSSGTGSSGSSGQYTGDATQSRPSAPPTDSG